MDENSTTTRLLTLLNISATKLGKRKRDFDKSELSATPDGLDEIPPNVSGEMPSNDYEQPPEPSVISAVSEELTANAYERHFGLSPVGLTAATREAVERRAWKLVRGTRGRLGPIAEYMPDGAEVDRIKSSIISVRIEHFLPSQY